MTTDWESWRKHVDYVIDTHGAWYGIGDGDGAPLADLPAPLPGSPAPDQWMDAEDLEITIPTGTGAGASWFADTYVMEQLDQLEFDESGRSILIAVENITLQAAFRGRDGETQRRGGVVTHLELFDDENDGIPNRIVIHALNVMDAWNTIPAVSWPAAWWKSRPYPRREDEAGLAYSQEWMMARVELATKHTFTWKKGRAGFVIRRLAQESIDAVMMTQADPDGTRWVDDAFHVVEVPEKDLSPVISLAARDGSLWETVAEQAKNAGVILGARIWWPGDTPVRCWSPVGSGTAPRDVDISPSEGESARVVGERVFSHAMIVLSVKEVGVRV